MHCYSNAVSFWKEHWTRIADGSWKQHGCNIFEIMISRSTSVEEDIDVHSFRSTDDRAHFCTEFDPSHSQCQRVLNLPAVTWLVPDIGLPWVVAITCYYNFLFFWTTVLFGISKIPEIGLPLNDVFFSTWKSKPYFGLAGWPHSERW